MISFEYLVANHRFDAFIRFPQLTRTQFRETRLIEPEMGSMTSEKTF